MKNLKIICRKSKVGNKRSGFHSVTASSIKLINGAANSVNQLNEKSNPPAMLGRME